MNIYIRFNEVPENEISQVHDGDAGVVRDEVGVCVFDCINRNETYRIVLPSCSTGCLHDLLNFIDYTRPNIYLVTGDEVGTGTYNEPCLKNVKILHKLEIVEHHSPIPLFKLDRTNRQLIIKN
jgi:hypothetical protein